MPQLKIIKQITKRESLSTERYLQDVKNIPLLTIQEEIKLAKRIRKGDSEAEEKLVLANLRFVISVAKQYQNRGISLNDLINEGNIGLIKAAKRFDETRGFKFISYAVWWIRQKITQALYEKARTMRRPLNQVSIVQRIYGVYRDLGKKLERDPTIDEVADELEIPADNVEQALKGNMKIQSNEMPFSQEDGGTFQDILEDGETPLPENELMANMEKEEVASLLLRLDERARDIIVCHFGIADAENGKRCFPMPLDEIGLRNNLTRERVRQLKEQALKTLQAYIKGRRCLFQRQGKMLSAYAERK